MKLLSQLITLDPIIVTSGMVAPLEGNLFQANVAPGEKMLLGVLSQLIIKGAWCLD